MCQTAPIFAVICGLVSLIVASPGRAQEDVTFDSYVLPPTEFKLERAKKAGVTLEAKPAQRILGVLARPPGQGPFPAVVLMHGCGGRWAWNDVWRVRLVSWGYVVLDVDSFGPRGLENGICSGSGIISAGPLTRALDAHAAKDFLAGLAFVDGARIAVLGMSHGGMSVLQAIHDGTTRKIGSTPFRAAVAFYPVCESYIDPDAPLLVLIGALDNWTQADDCARFDAVHGADPDVTVVVYPGAHHVFDYEGVARTYRNYFVMRYHPEAAKDAETRIKAFLARHL